MKYLITLFLFVVSCKADDGSLSNAFNRMYPTLGNDFGRLISMDKTNYTINTIYTNNYNRIIQISQIGAGFTIAAISGKAVLEYRIAGPFGFTNQISKTTALLSVVIGTETNAIPAFMVPANHSYSFVDASIGVGNSITVNGGQITVF